MPCRRTLLLTLPVSSSLALVLILLLYSIILVAADEDISRSLDIPGPVFRPMKLGTVKNKKQQNKVQIEVAS